jgi:hypothetical protein
MRGDIAACRRQSGIINSHLAVPYIKRRIDGNEEQVGYIQIYHIIVIVKQFVENPRKIPKDDDEQKDKA